MFRSARNRLRPVWITFVWNCLPCFSNTKIGSVTSSFDIVQFSRSCALQPFGWRPVHFTTEVVFCQVLFSKLLNFSELGALLTSQNWPWACRGVTPPFPYGNRPVAQTPHWGVCCYATASFRTSIGSFQRLRAETSEVILLSQRLALKYNTTLPLPCQHFLTSFLKVFCVHRKQ